MDTKTATSITADELDQLRAARAKVDMASAQADLARAEMIVCLTQIAARYGVSRDAIDTSGAITRDETAVKPSPAEVEVQSDEH